MKKVLSLAALAALFAFPVMAQPQCVPMVQGISQLVYQYGEEVIDRVEVQKDGQSFVFAFWANPETMTWTITLTQVEGPVICGMDYGDDYHDVDFRAWVHRATGGQGA